MVYSARTNQPKGLNMNTLVSTETPAGDTETLTTQGLSWHYKGITGKQHTLQLTLSSLGELVSASEVQSDRVPSALEPRLRKMLALLAAKRGTVVTKEMLLDHFYGEAPKEPYVEIFSVFLCHLRAALDDYAKEPEHQLVRAVWGRGYYMRPALEDPAVVPVPAEVHTNRPVAVRGPHGEVITLDNLPASFDTRWVIRRKEEVVLAVRGNLLSASEARARYKMCERELNDWERTYLRFGTSGLRTTRVQDYR